MKNPLPRWLEQILAVACIVAALWLWLHAERRRAADGALADVQLRAATARAKAWQSFYATYAGRVDTIADTVTRVRAVLRVDTLWRHDTTHVAGDTVQRTLVPTSTLGRMDAALRACGRLASSVVPLHAACDSLVAAANDRTAAVQAKLDAERPRWYDRIGINAGYGVMQDGTVVRAGPVLAISVRVWP